MSTVRKFKQSALVYLIIYLVLLVVPVIPIAGNMVELQRIQYYVAIAMGVGTFFFLLSLCCIENMVGRVGGLFEAVLAPLPAVIVAAYFLESLAVAAMVGVYLLLMLIYWDIQERKFAKESSKE